MPMPVAHGSIGAAIVAVYWANQPGPIKKRTVLAGALLAISPDFDVFFSGVLGLGNNWHRGFSHSIIYAAICGLLTALALNAGSIKGVLAYAAATCSHALLDALTSRTRGGVELFWPITERRFQFGFLEYFDFQLDLRYDGLRVVVAELFRSTLIEFVIFLPVIVFSIWIVRKHGPPTTNRARVELRTGL